MVSTFLPAFYRKQEQPAQEHAFICAETGVDYTRWKLEFAHVVPLESTLFEAFE